MSIEYSGGTIVNTTYTSDGTRSGMQAWLVAQLEAAGWTVYAGSGSDITLMSVVSPQGLSIKFRFYDPGSGNCVQVTMQSITPALVSNIGYLLPTSGVTYRLIANKYQFFVFASGTAFRKTARYFLMGGVPWVASNIQAYLGAMVENGWFIYAGTSDTDTETCASFRTRVNTASGNGFFSSTIWAGSLANWTTDTSPCPNLEVRRGSDYGGYIQFADGSLKAFEAFIGWYVASIGAAAIVGQLWDAIVVAGSFAGETTYTFDSRTYMAITDNSEGWNHSLLVVVA